MRRFLVLLPRSVSRSNSRDIGAAAALPSIEGNTNMICIPSSYCFACPAKDRDRHCFFAETLLSLSNDSGARSMSTYSRAIEEGHFWEQE